MIDTHLILEDLLNRLRQAPGRSEEEVISDLQRRYQCSAYTARSLLGRANHALEAEARRWIIRRRYQKPLSGETSGRFDNVIRLLEDASPG